MEDQNKRATCLWSSKSSQFISTSERLQIVRAKLSGRNESKLRSRYPFIRWEMENLHPTLRQNKLYGQPYGKVRLRGINRRLRVSGNESQANGPQFVNPSSLGFFLPGPQLTSWEMAASLLSFCSSEIGTWISSGWLKLNPDKSRAMLIGSGKEFEEVTRNATSCTVKKAFPQSGLGGGYTATGAQKNADKRTSLS